MLVFNDVWQRQSPLVARPGLCLTIGLAFSYLLRYLRPCLTYAYTVGGGEDFLGVGGAGLHVHEGEGDGGGDFFLGGGEACWTMT